VRGARRKLTEVADSDNGVALPDEYVFPIVGDPHSKYEVTRIAE
jgi:hypothetical protein